MIKHLSVLTLAIAAIWLVWQPGSLVAATDDFISPLWQRVGGQILGVKINCGSDFVDSRDNQIYPTSQIGSACWMTKPLNANAAYGTTITTNGLKYYSWLAASNNDPELNSKRGLCPEGWRLPSEDDIVNLAKAEGGNCDKLNDGFNTNYCQQKANQPFMMARSSNDRLYYIQNSKIDDMVFWSGTIITTNAVKYIKYGLLPKTGVFSNYLFTDISRLSWNNPYNYINGLVFCIQDNGGESGGNDGNLNTYYLDADNDGYGNPNLSISAAAKPNGYSINNTDCNDANNKIYPGATEYCNQIDDNCNGQIDEGCQTPPGNTNFVCGQNLLDTRDSQNYKTEKIGNHCWMIEPLHYDSRDSVNQIINNGNSFYAWPKATNGKIDISGGEQGLCPNGWHLPTINEIKNLGLSLSGQNCQQLSDAWGTLHCSNSSSFLGKSNKITNRRYYLAPSTEYKDLHFWSSDTVRIANGEEYLAFGAFSNAPEFFNNLMTDYVRKSWNRSAYMFNSIYCVQNYVAETLNTYYRDADNDNYGNPLESKQAAVKPTGYVDNNKDCNDNNKNIYPGAPEPCGSIDLNCDGRITACARCYRDADKDGYGDINIYRATLTNGSCPVGYVDNSRDCNDRNNRVKPGAVEICGNNIDDDCDGVKDNGCKICYRDYDKDGYGNPKSFRAFTPAANCSAGYVDNSRDCNDRNNRVKPGAVEICGNNIDDDCDGVKDNGCKICYRDYDKDGYGNPNIFRIVNPTANCPTGYVTNKDDCNDSDKNNTKGRGNCK